MTTDEKYMNRCIELANRGLGNTYPNPLVGSVIVHQNKIIGEGFHQKYGEAHAEVNAVKNVQDKSLLTDSTLYVNLEPCAHFGKTPPCADLIIQNKIPKVVIGIIDPFSKVCGEGIARMKKAGVEVVVGVLEKECKEVNKRFLWNVKKDLPYVILKWAQTSDGFIDKNRTSEEAEINWITSKSTKAITHQWRSEEAGILVGINTLIKDNPELTLREVEGNNPVRIIIDPSLKSEKKDFKIFDVAGSNLIYNKEKSEIHGNTEYILIEDFSLNNILKDLKTRNVSSVIIEGGKHTLEKFIEDNLWNEARIYTGNKKFESGLDAPEISDKYLTSSQNLEKDQLHIYKNTDC